MLSDIPPVTTLSSTGFGPPQDLDTDSKSFSISGAHLVKDRLQKLYLGFCSTIYAKQLCHIPIISTPKNEHIVWITREMRETA